MARKYRPFMSSSDGDEAPINITPLIDVVFVVLIMFIIIAPMLELDRVTLASSLHRDEKIVRDVQESSPLAIHVRQDNSVWINNRKITPNQMVMVFKEYKKKFPHRIPQLFHDKKAYFETYQTVKNSLEAAGFEEMDVILQPG